MGYEDEDEFEDALGGSFRLFLGKFPHLETKECDDKDFYRVVKMKEQPACTMKITV